MLYFDQFTASSLSKGINLLEKKKTRNITLPNL